MKFLFFFAMVTLYVAFALAQCPGNPARPSCQGPRDVGTRTGTNCRRNAGRRWWYNSATRTCREMNYLGCGGNNNRFCSLEACRRRCVRPTVPTTTASPE